MPLVEAETDQLAYQKMHWESELLSFVISIWANLNVQLLTVVIANGSPLTSQWRIKKTSNGVLHWFVNVQFIYVLASLIIMDIQPRELMCSQYTISMKKSNFCLIAIPWLWYISFSSYLLHEYFTDSNILFRLQVASKFMPISNVIIGKI